MYLTGSIVECRISRDDSRQTTVGLIILSRMWNRKENCVKAMATTCEILFNHQLHSSPLRYILLCVSNKIHFPHVSWVFFHFLIYLRSNRLDFRHLFCFYVLELNLSSCLDLSFNSHLPVLFTYMLLYILCLMISSRYRQTATERRSPFSQSY